MSIENMFGKLDKIDIIAEKPDEKKKKKRGDRS